MFNKKYEIQANTRQQLIIADNKKKLIENEYDIIY